jgi:hypothetical protein
MFIVEVQTLFFIHTRIIRFAILLIFHNSPPAFDCIIQSLLIVVTSWSGICLKKLIVAQLSRDNHPFMMLTLLPLSKPVIGL